MNQAIGGGPAAGSLESRDAARFPVSTLAQRRAEYDIWARRRETGTTLAANPVTPIRSLAMPWERPRGSRLASPTLQPTSGETPGGTPLDPLVWARSRDRRRLEAPPSAATAPEPRLRGASEPEQLRETSRFQPSERDSRTRDTEIRPVRLQHDSASPPRSSARAPADGPRLRPLDRPDLRDSMPRSLARALPVDLPGGLRGRSADVELPRPQARSSSDAPALRERRGPDREEVLERLRSRRATSREDLMRPRPGSGADDLDRRRGRGERGGGREPGTGGSVVDQIGTALRSLDRQASDMGRQLDEADRRMAAEGASAADRKALSDLREQTGLGTYERAKAKGSEVLGRGSDLAGRASKAVRGEADAWQARKDRIKVPVPALKPLADVGSKALSMEMDRIGDRFGSMRDAALEKLMASRRQDAADEQRRTRALENRRRKADAG